MLNTGSANIDQQDLGKLAQDTIACRVAIGVVDRFEVIQINNDNRKW